MREIKVNIDGDLTTKEVQYFGGNYSLWQQLKKKGIGSPKLVYRSGIKTFDELKRDIEGEICFVNFELLKKGLILRLNVNQKHKCAGAKFEDIESIHLEAQRIKILVKGKEKIVHWGKLEINNNLSKIQLIVRTKDFKSVHQYFKKPEFSNLFESSVSENPPEKDYGHLGGIIGGII